MTLVIMIRDIKWWFWFWGFFVFVFGFAVLVLFGLSFFLFVGLWVFWGFFVFSPRHPLRKEPCPNC